MQFARDNPGVNVVGVGAGHSSNGDSLELAQNFMARFGADAAGLTMIYDVSFQSWRTFGVTTQPWVILFDVDGNMVYNQPGRVDLSGASALLGA